MIGPFITHWLVSRLIHQRKTQDLLYHVPGEAHSSSGVRNGEDMKKQLGAIHRVSGRLGQWDFVLEVTGAGRGGPPKVSEQSRDPGREGGASSWPRRGQKRAQLAVLGENPNPESCPTNTKQMWGKNVTRQKIHLVYN